MRTHYRIFISLIIAAFFLTYILLFIDSGIFLLLHNPKAMDFIAFYTGSQLVVHSPALLYSFHSQLLIEQHIAPITPALFIAYINPPFTALLFEPLIKFGLTNAYAVWIFLNGLFLVFLCYSADQQLKKYKLYWRVLLLLCTMTFIPILNGLLLGQLSIFLAVIVLLSWIFLQKGWEFRSGLMLSLLLIKPQLLVVPFIALAVARRGKLFLGLCTGIFFWILISYFLVGWNGITAYIILLMNASQGDVSYDLGVMAQHSLQTFLLILFHTQSVSKIHAVWISVVICLVAPTLFLWSKRNAFSSVQFSFQFILLIIVTLLTSPHTHVHDLSILIVIPIILFSVMHKLQKRQKKMFFALLVSGYLIQLVAYLFELHALTITQPIWIVVNVLYLLLFCVILMKELYKLSEK